MSFAFSKIAWAIIAPANLFVLLLAFAAFRASSYNREKRKSGASMCSALAVFLLFLTVFPVGDWLLLKLEHKDYGQIPENVAGVIMLSGDESPALTEATGVPSAGTVAGRYLTFAALARKFPDAALVFSGGSGELSPERTSLTNKDVAGRILTGLGVDERRVVFEYKSRNTFENAEFSFDEVKPDAEQNWLLVTSAYHMPRAMASFKHAGWNVFPAAADYRTSGKFRFKLSFNLMGNLYSLQIAVREYVGLLYYRLMGRIDSLW